MATCGYNSVGQIFTAAVSGSNFISSGVVTQAGAPTGGYAYYLPFGASRSGQVNLTQKRFTGQYHEAALPGGAGLYDYGARWYDARVGRFVTPDSLIPNPANPQDLNRYSYVRNNPTNLTDPDGHEPHDPQNPCSYMACVRDLGGQWIVKPGQRLTAEDMARSFPDSSFGTIDDFQTALDTVGLVDPTPISDGVNAIISLTRGQYPSAGISAIAMLPYLGDALKLGRAVGVVRGGARVVNGIDSFVGTTIVRHISSPLSPLLKQSLRGEARQIFDVINPGIRAGLDLQIHHRIPLEWAHLFPYANPNRAANLIGVPAPVHQQITSQWSLFKKTLAGRIPTASEVQSFARRLDNRYGMYYR